MGVVSDYLALFKNPADAEKLTRIFWSISQFPDDLLFAKLQQAAGSDFSDDYSEFLKRNNLLKAGLAVLGLDSPRQIERIIAENPGVPERLANVTELFSGPTEGYLAEVQQISEKDYPGYFPCLMATVAILLVRSKDYLDKWSKDFSRIIERHPTPGQSIKNVLSLVFRGEALIVDNYSAPHRNFNACSKLFVSLVNDEDDEAKNLIWAKKHTRILDALGGK